MKASISSLALALALPAASFAAQTLSNYQFIVSSQAPGTYFKLDNSLASAVDPGVVLESFGQGGFTFDAFRNPGNSYYYFENTDFLRLLGTTTNVISGGGTSNTTSTAAGSITLLFRSLDPGTNAGQRFVFSGGDSTSNHNALALFFENPTSENPLSLKLRFGDDVISILAATNIQPNTWYYFALTYLESRAPNKATWYLGRPGAALTSGMTSNSDESVAGDGVSLVIGNRQSLSGALRNPGNGQLDEFAVWNRELTPAEINAQFAALPASLVAPPASGYQGLIASQLPTYYFKLDGSLSNAVAAEPVLTPSGASPGFTFDYFGNLTTTNAASFTAVNDAIFVNSNLVSGGGSFTGTPGSGKGSISFLFHSLSGTNTTGQRFLFSAGGGTGATNGFGVFMENWNATSSDPGAIKVRLGNASRPILQPQDIVPGDWYYFAMTYDESLTDDQVTWYLGQPGTPLKSGVLDYVAGAIAGQGNIFIIGNHTNFNGAWRNPGVGRVDEFAIWHRVLTPTEVTNQFLALNPASSVPSPALKIRLEGGNVLLAWPADTPNSFVLESTNVLNATTIGAASWPSAGTPAVVGSDYVVTNAVGSGSRFYRLHQP